MAGYTYAANNPITFSDPTGQMYGCLNGPCPAPGPGPGGNGQNNNGAGTTRTSTGTSTSQAAGENSATLATALAVARALSGINWNDWGQFLANNAGINYAALPDAATLKAIQAGVQYVQYAQDIQRQQALEAAAPSYVERRD